MVLGFILYETVDVVYNFGALVFGGGKYIYRWYYDIHPPNQQKEIEMLLKRIEVLEQLSLTNGSDNSHEQTEKGEKK